MTTPKELEALRQRVIERLTDAYANDEIDLEAFEDRVERAEAATDPAALEALVGEFSSAAAVPDGALVPASAAGDASLAAATATRAPTSTALVPIEEVPEKRSLVTIFGSVTRNKRWTVPRRLRVLSIFGGTDLDFREARLAPGVTEISVLSVMAGVHVLVPPDLPVEIDGTGILGSFEEVDAVDAGTGDEAACRLRIKGVALLSGVEVEQRLPGETKRQAKKRRKRQRKVLQAASADRLLAERAGEGVPKDHPSEDHSPNDG